MTERVERLAEHVGSRVDELERDFERLLVESSTLAFRVAYGVLRQREDAEDVAQEAIIKAHRHFHRLRARDRFRPWLVRITWRLALDRQRSNRRRARRESGDMATPSLNPLSDAGQAERVHQLWEAIDALPQKLRMAIVLAGIEGHDIREVASLLAVPEGTVKSRLFLARERLREALR
jgi:RNA polymerase sigma-70 factor, ECF subfamily